MAAGKAWWEVSCPKHGIMNFHSTIKVVKVGPPGSKKVKHSGCPICRKERNLGKIQNG